MAFVVDASVALAWHFEDEVTLQTDALFARTVEEQIVVPSHWMLEVANGALMGERRKRASASDTDIFAARLAWTDIIVDDVAAQDAFLRILPLARNFHLTVYDALYLELAERRRLPLATLDVALATAGRLIGIEILGI